VFLPLMMFIPGAVALSFRLLSHEGFRDLLRPLGLGRSWKAYIFSFFYPVLFIVSCAGIAYGLNLATFQSSQIVQIIPQQGWFSFTFNILLVLGEEYGWRGYLLPLASRVFNQILAVIIVGVVWAFWHVPYLYISSQQFGAPDPLKLCMIQMVAVFVFSFPFSYLYFRAQSILPAMIFHLTWNIFNPIILGSIYRNASGIMIGKVITINGEGITGAILGCLFVGYYVRAWLKFSGKNSLISGDM